MGGWWEAFMDVMPGMLGYVFLACVLWLFVQVFDRVSS